VQASACPLILEDVMNNKIEYTAELLQDGHLSVPEDIKEKLRQITNYKIKVRIEFSEIDKSPIKNFSFHRARKLLASIPGELSADIVKEREDRV
jgi:hypothetical protein